MKQGSLVVFKTSRGHVLGTVVYLIGEHLSVQVDHSNRLLRGRYLVNRKEIKCLKSC